MERFPNISGDAGLTFLRLLAFACTS